MKINYILFGIGLSAILLMSFKEKQHTTLIANQSSMLENKDSLISILIYKVNKLGYEVK